MPNEIRGFAFIIFYLILQNIAFSDIIDELNNDPLASLGSAKKNEVSDPFIKYNEKMYLYNINYYKRMNPFESWYSTTSIEIRWTIKTLSFHYSNQIFYMFYNFIDGDLEGFLLSFWKFYINTIFGLGGLYDIADKLEIPLASKTIDDIFYKLGITNIPYFILPISGEGTVFKACSFLIENAFRFISGIPLFLYALNLPNAISEDIDFARMSGDFSSYKKYKKIFFSRYINEREKNFKNRNNRLKLTNPCDNRNNLEPCVFESDEL